MADRATSLDEEIARQRKALEERGDGALREELGRKLSELEQRIALRLESLRVSAKI